MVENQFLCHTPSKQDRDVIEEKRFRNGMLFIDRELQRQPECHTPRDDRNLMDRVGAWKKLGHQGMT